MAQYINTNVASLNAQRNLTNSSSSMNTAMQRLSTGLRINSAKDDAAGLAISERFTTQIRGLDQAMRNANDGISLSQTAEGALGELTNNLQRIRELAVQSANATNSDTDRAALDDEVQQRIAEIDRIATQTSFNGLNVLDGSAGSATFQVGANVGETISLGLNTNMRSSAIGQIASATRTVSGTGLSGDLTIAIGSNTARAVGASASGSAEDVAAAINAANITGLSTTAENSQTGTFSAVGGSAGNTYELVIDGETIYASGSDAAAGLTSQEIADAVNANANLDVTASISGTTITLANTTGANIVVTENSTSGTFGFSTGTLIGDVSLTANENITIGGSTDAAVLGSPSVITLDTTQSLETLDVKDVANANDTIARIDSALTAVNGFRSDLGAIQNRLESTIVNLQTTSENLSASRGRIRDADFATETASLTRSQILQQAGVAMLSQANAQPQIALSLLG
ncbi:MAG: flagellin [Gammaproteobacteria bacterium]